MRKFLLTAALVVLANSAAFAGTIGDTIGDWSTAGPLVQGDKTYTYISVTGAGATDEAATTVNTAVNGNVYTFQNAGLAALTDNVVLRYEVTITDPNKVFDLWQFNQNGILGNGGVSTSTNKIFSDSGFTNQIVSTTLTGSSSDNGAFTSNLTTIWVEQAYNGISATKSIGSVSLDVTQKTEPVPEPSSFALLGLGGLGLAIRAYRRRPVAA